MADTLVTYDAATVVGTWADDAQTGVTDAADANVQSTPGTGLAPGAVAATVPPATTAWMEQQEFFFDFYFRIWITPSGLDDIGGVSSEQTIQISVWNAYPFDTKTLASVDIQGLDDNTLVTPGNTPLDFGILAMKNYTLIVSASGTPVIDVLITWNFTGEPALSLNVVGFRTKIWAVPLDWRNPPLDRFEWLTDVQESRSGFEQRLELRQAPRRTIEGTFIVTGDDLGWFDAMLFSWGARGFLVPIWYDSTILTAALPNGSARVYCDTTDREFVVGGFVIIGNDLRTAAAMQISEVYSDGLLLTRPVSVDIDSNVSIWPARAARVTSPAQQTQHTAGVIEMRITFEITDQDDIDPIASDTSMDGYQVLTRDHNWLYTIERSYARKLTILDNSTALPQWLDLSNWSQITRQLKMLLQDRSNRRDFIGWLSSVAGRLTPFWREDRETMLRMTASQPVGETALLHIVPIGFPTLLYGQPCRMAVSMRHVDGTVYYRKIVNAQTDVTTGDEVLTLETTIPASVASDWRLISYLEFVRLDADAIEIAHQSDEVSEVQFSIRGVKQ